MYHKIDNIFLQIKLLATLLLAKIKKSSIAPSYTDTILYIVKSRSKSEIWVTMSSANIGHLGILVINGANEFVIAY